MSVASLLLLTAAPTLAIPPETSAPVAYLTDVSSGATLYARDAKRRIPTASMAKMMTAWVAFEALKTGKLKADQQFVVSKNVWTQWNNTGSSMYLKASEKVSVENLLHGILTVSGNDASVVLAEGMAGSEAAFTKLMNVEAKKLGMVDSHFGTANGWPDQGVTYSTAHDLSLLAHKIITEHPVLFRQYFGQRSFTWSGITQPNRNPLLGAITGADGMKTGHSDEAGYCLVGTVQQGKRRLLMVVAGLPTQAVRISEARHLMQWGFDAWHAKPLFNKGRIVAHIPVQLGTKSRIGVVAPHDLMATIAKGEKPKLTLRVRYKGPVKAPFQKGAQIAQLIVKFPNGAQQVMPLVAVDAVQTAGFWGRAWNGAKSLVGA
jgi:serine-type D-Ala-D-Ala carboxypeptidase (penicillin-binding protein 5/6)